MKEFKAWYIWAKKAQYKSVMSILYELEIFPMEEDPKDIQDYIDNFNFAEEVNGMLKFLLYYPSNESVIDIETKFSRLSDYDKECNLPRIERDSDNDFYKNEEKYSRLLDDEQFDIL